MSFWVEMMEDPAFKRAHEEASAQMDRSVPVLCAWGTCTHLLDPLDGKIYGGWGDPFCGCDNLPGWRSSRPDGLPKPAAAVKARGRHGSRVQRSRHRRAEWKAMLCP